MSRRCVLALAFAALAAIAILAVRLLSDAPDRRVGGEGDAVPAPAASPLRSSSSSEGPFPRQKRRDAAAVSGPIVAKADPSVEVVPDPPSTPEEIAEAKAAAAEAAFDEALAAVVARRQDEDLLPDERTAAAFKPVFDGLSPAQRVENIHEVLALDDDYLPLIAALALDAKEPAEALEAIAEDLANREADKVRPIFEKIAAQASHPARAIAREQLED